MFSPVIKWSGSKRSQAERIAKLLPEGIRTYYEPFVGGGSVLYAVRPRIAVCGDICRPLIDLWNLIRNNPEELSAAYERRWIRLRDEGYGVYYEIRDEFNREKRPEDLLFLSRTCVNGLIRFNANGEFNNSFHLTRPGIDPQRLKKTIYDWSGKIQCAKFVCADYRESTKDASEGDFVYLDPPYFHTKGRYYGGIDFDEFLSFLEDLNSRGVRYMLSFDGTRGESDYRVDLPGELYKRRDMLPSGNSSFKKVMDGENQQVYESLYLNW